MYKLLVTLMLIAALSELGLSMSELQKNPSRDNLHKLEKHSRDVLKIHWKPISVFPEEAKRFR